MFVLNMIPVFLSICNASQLAAGSFTRTKGNEVRVRFEDDFKASNGPDLYVRLIKKSDVKDYVELGKLQGNIGSQSYAIPAGTNLAEYDSVIVWCKQFSVLFGTAKLASL